MKPHKQLDFNKRACYFSFQSRTRSAESSYLSVLQCIDNGISCGRWQHVSRGGRDSMRDAHEVFVSHTLCARGRPRWSCLDTSLMWSDPPPKSVSVPLLDVLFSQLREVRRAWSASPVTTATVPEWVARRWPPASGAGRSGVAPTRGLLPPHLPLHAQMFPHRPQRWARRSVDATFVFSSPHPHCPAAWKFSQSCPLHRRTRHVGPVHSHTRGPVHSVTVWRGGLAWRHHKDNNQSWEWGGGAQGGQQLQGGSRHSNSKRSTVPNAYPGIVRTCMNDARLFQISKPVDSGNNYSLNIVCGGKEKGGKKRGFPIKQSDTSQSKPKSRIYDLCSLKSWLQPC